ncbi:hypothetical protein LX32DRAFT_640607 [Colletotrichum zoysiae]|uniref:Uncharacterized protein n=1 Tax=Colletotrichum zoysiae TaxID=1216348 RepID=A0AAD9HET0_9PEZI|nr:hypothetical protein LX32DRAFT_640607 [Colletotrichum zoysiae]
MNREAHSPNGKHFSPPPQEGLDPTRSGHSNYAVHYSWAATKMATNDPSLPPPYPPSAIPPPSL